MDNYKVARLEVEENTEKAFNEIREILKKYDCTLECSDYSLEIYSDVDVGTGHKVRANRFYDTNDFVN